MICNACKLDHPPLMRCEVARNMRGPVVAGVVQVGALRNQSVTTTVTPCNQCVTKDVEIERLRNQIREMESKGRAKPKRDRAEYMKKWRADHAVI